MLKFIAIAAVALSLIGCSTQRIAAQVGAEEAQKNFDAIGRLEARAVCLVRLGLYVRSDPEWQKAVMGAAKQVCTTK